MASLEADTRLRSSLMPLHMNKARIEQHLEASYVFVGNAAWLYSTFQNDRPALKKKYAYNGV